MLCKQLTSANVVTIVILCSRSNPRYIKVREANSGHIRFQVKEDDIDSTAEWFTGEIVLPKQDSATNALWKFWSLKLLR